MGGARGMPMIFLDELDVEIAREQEQVAACVVRSSFGCC